MFPNGVKFIGKQTWFMKLENEEGKSFQFAVQLHNFEEYCQRGLLKYWPLNRIVLSEFMTLISFN